MASESVYLQYNNQQLRKNEQDSLTNISRTKKRTTQYLQLVASRPPTCLSLLKPTGHVMHQQFNIQLLYLLHTLYLCVLYLSENKQRLVPLTA